MEEEYFLKNCMFKGTLDLGMKSRKLWKRDSGIQLMSEGVCHTSFLNIVDGISVTGSGWSLTVVVTDVDLQCLALNGVDLNWYPKLACRYRVGYGESRPARDAVSLLRTSNNGRSEASEVLA